jgi:hypothetical protein
LPHIYDLVWYLSDPESPPPNKPLLANALRQAGFPEPAGPAHKWHEALTDRLVDAPWEGVRQDVERFLERPADLWMVEKEAVLAMLAQQQQGR